jgi:lipopolysaccharide transport system permease protein
VRGEPGANRTDPGVYSAEKTGYSALPVQAPPRYPAAMVIHETNGFYESTASTVTAILIPENYKQSAWREALSDIFGGLAKREVAFVFGWQDIIQRYRRSKVGAFWLTLNMGVMIGALGLIFGTLFRSSMTEFLPFVTTGMIMWGLISGIINEGCLGFSSSEGIILQVRMPLFTHIIRIWWRNTIIFLHNLVIYPVVMIFFLHNPGWMVLISPFGFIIVTINLFWMALALAVLCARYRDMPQIIQNILQIFFYATPLMWMPKNLPQGTSLTMLNFNPFYHLVNLVRMPLLGEAPSLENWIVGIGMALIGWVATLGFFGHYRWRIPYWL